jgi:hypothetical protein
LVLSVVSFVADFTGYFNVTTDEAFSDRVFSSQLLFDHPLVFSDPVDQDYYFAIYSVFGRADLNLEYVAEV